MDPTRFDRLVRTLAHSRSRRAALVGFLSGLAVPLLPDDAAAARGNGKRKRRGNSGEDDRRRNRGDAEAEGKRRKRRKRKNKKKRGPRGNDGGQTPPPAPVCCGAKSCADPERGSTRSGCDFAGRSFAGQDLNGSTFRGIDGREANFTATDNHGSVFAEACLQGGRFRRAKLDGSTWGGACLFDADFTGADFGGDFTLFDEALFCGTVMPDGSVNDRDCGRESACCRAELGGGDPECQNDADCADETCRTKACTNGQCAYSVVADEPSPNDQCDGHCCEGDCCPANATSCDPQGLCCVPNCAGRQCGPDGCGGNGTCGACPVNEVCDDISGVCLCTRQSCPEGCCTNGPGNPGACQPGTTPQNCGSGGGACRQCTAQEQCEDGACEPDTCAGSCTQDNDCPDLRNCVCNRAEGTCCARTCTGKVCGSDGCGGTCENLCPPNTVCGPNGTTCLCTAESCPNGCCSNGLGTPGTCEPGNTNQACGHPGQDCQTCTGREQCQNEQCVCIPLTCDDQDIHCGTFSDGCGHTLECGTCPDPEFPSCFVGVCVPCTIACTNGQDCVNLTNGDTICHTNTDINCGEPCSTNASCTDDQYPICIASITNGANSNPPNQTTPVAAFCQGEPAACGALE